MRSRLIICRAPTRCVVRRQGIGHAKRDVGERPESKPKLASALRPDERSGTDLGNEESENAATGKWSGKKGVRDGSGRDGGAGGPGVPGAETTVAPVVASAFPPGSPLLIERRAITRFTLSTRSFSRRFRR